MGRALAGDRCSCFRPASQRSLWWIALLAGSHTWQTVALGCDHTILSHCQWYSAKLHAPFTKHLLVSCLGALPLFTFVFSVGRICSYFTIWAVSWCGLATWDTLESCDYFASHCPKCRNHIPFILCLTSHVFVNLSWPIQRSVVDLLFQVLANPLRVFDTAP